MADLIQIFLIFFRTILWSRRNDSQLLFIILMINVLCLLAERAITVYVSVASKLLRLTAAYIEMASIRWCCESATVCKQCIVFMWLAMSSYPLEWEDMMGKAMIKVPLAHHSSEYIKVIHLFQASRPSYSQVLQVSLVIDFVQLVGIYSK